MIKVLIVVYGLILLVPDGPPDTDPAGLTVLVLDSDAWQMPVKHVPGVEQVGGASADLTLGSDFQVVFKTANVGSIDLTGLAHLVPLDELTDIKDEGRVKSECLDPAMGCLLDGKPMVAGRIRFEGLWRTRPVSRCLTYETPLDYRDQALYDFRPQGDLSTPVGTPRRLATALVFETDVRDLSSVEVELTKNGLPPQSIALLTSEKLSCQVFIHSDVSECVVIEVANRADVHVDPRCRTATPPQACRADTHFAAFYDLVTPPGSRRIPFVKEKYFECDSRGGVGNYPAIRCPPTTALPEE